jgi:hypothetical protein
MVQRPAPDVEAATLLPVETAIVLRSIGFCAANGVGLCYDFSSWCAQFLRMSSPMKSPPRRHVTSQVTFSSSIASFVAHQMALYSANAD